MAILGSTERGRYDTPTRDLSAYLHGEYRVGVPWKLTVRHPSATGYQLSDRIVSRLEIANAVRQLPYRQRRIIEMTFEQGWSPVRVCLALSISSATFHRDKAEALRAVVGVVYEWSACTEERITA